MCEMKFMGFIQCPVWVLCLRFPSALDALVVDCIGFPISTWKVWVRVVFFPGGYMQAPYEASSVHSISGCLCCWDPLVSGSFDGIQIISWIEGTIVVYYNNSKVAENSFWTQESWSVLRSGGWNDWKMKVIEKMHWGSKWGIEKEIKQAKPSSNDAGGLPPAAKRLRHHRNAKQPLKPFLKIFLPVFFHVLPPWFLLCGGYILVFESCSMHGLWVRKRVWVLAFQMDWWCMNLKSY